MNQEQTLSLLGIVKNQYTQKHSGKLAAAYSLLETEVRISVAREPIEIQFGRYTEWCIKPIKDRIDINDIWELKIKNEGDKMPGEKFTNLRKMDLNKQELDKYLTTEPDNGFNTWLEKVWDLIPDAVISQKSYDDNEKFFEDGANDIALKNNGHENVSPRYASHVIVSRYRILKQYPECKTWEEVNKHIHDHNL